MKKLNILFLSLLLVSCSNGNSSTSTSSENEVSSSSSVVSSTNNNVTTSSTSNTVTTSTNTPSSSVSTKEEETSSTSSSIDAPISSTIISSSVNSDLPPISYVKVFAPVEFTHIYAWVDTSSGVKELCSSWPGTYLKEYDEEWKTYDFIGYTEVNLIFSKGSNENQTQDLYAGEAGYYWYHNGGLRNYRPGEEAPEDDRYPSIPSYDAKDYKDFKFWDEYEDSYWTTINKYEGDRLDFRQESIYFVNMLPTRYTLQIKRHTETECDSVENIFMQV